HRGRYPLDRPPLAGDGLVDPPLQEAGDLVHHGEEDGFLAGEVKVDGALGGSRSPDDLIDRSLMVPPAGEDVNGRVEDPPPGGRLLLRPGRTHDPPGFRP